MTHYVCDKCGKIFSLKGDYLRHLNRKTPCKLNIFQNEYSSQRTKINSYECAYCHHSFSRSDSLRRHQNNNCCAMQSYDNGKEELFQLLLKERLERTKLSQQCEQLKKEVENCKNIINSRNNSNNTNHNTIDGSHNTTGNSKNITNNIQNTYNIKILPYGKEDLSHLTTNDYKKIIDQGFMSVPAFIEKIHFDKNHPQNHNIYISNMRDDYVIIYDGCDWKLVDKTETINNMYDDNSHSLEIKFNSIMEDLSDYAITKFQRFLDQVDDNDIKNNIKKDLKLLLYNHRKMTQNTKKQSS